MDLLSRVVFNSMSTGAGHCAAVTDTGLVYTWGQVAPEPVAAAHARLPDREDVSLIRCADAGPLRATRSWR